MMDGGMMDGGMMDGGMMGGGMMGGGMMGGVTDLEALEAAPVFDREFIEQMIPHHQMGVMMAQMVSGASGRPEAEGVGGVDRHTPDCRDSADARLVSGLVSVRRTNEGRPWMMWGDGYG